MFLTQSCSFFCFNEWKRLIQFLDTFFSIKICSQTQPHLRFLYPHRRDKSDLRKSLVNRTVFIFSPSNFVNLLQQKLRTSLRPLEGRKHCLFFALTRNVFPWTLTLNHDAHESFLTSKTAPKNPVTFSPSRSSDFTTLFINHQHCTENVMWGKKKN